jgi:hypothetical protein
MKTCLSVLLNYVFSKDLEALYGKGSYIIINYIKFCTVNKHYLIDCKLFLTDSSLFEESGFDGLTYLIKECIKWSSFDHDKFALVATYDLVT